jgi:hypothetical protein
MHLTLGYLPLRSSWHVSWMQREMNSVVCQYLHLSPDERPERLTHNRKFYIRNEDGPQSGVLDQRIDVQEEEFDHLQHLWASGQLWLNNRPHGNRSDSDDSADKMSLENTWTNAHERFIDRMQRSKAISDDLRDNPPPERSRRLGWKRLHAPAKSMNATLDAITLKGISASEAFDLAEYLVSWLWQVERSNRADDWNKRVHKLQHEGNLHITLRSRCKFHVKPPNVQMHSSNV